MFPRIFTQSKMIAFTLSMIEFVLVTVYAPLVSLKALELNALNDANMLTFWLTIGVMSAFENITCGMLWLFPLYAECRFSLLVYMLFFEGGKTVYKVVIDPAYKQAKKNIPANILDALAKKGRSDQAILGQQEKQKQAEKTIKEQDVEAEATIKEPQARVNEQSSLKEATCMLKEQEKPKEPEANMQENKLKSEPPQAKAPQAETAGLLPPGPAPQPPGCDDKLPAPPPLPNAPLARLERGVLLGKGAVGRVFAGWLQERPVVFKEAGCM
eukprot:symbB.v1.2.013510.t1/scaffold795.1/size259473/2